MSLVSNFIGEISSTQFGNNKVPNKLDIDDKTFANILEKQMNANIEEPQGIDLNSLGAPAGMNIEELEGIDSINNIDSTPLDNKNPLDVNNDGDITASEAATFFTSLLDSNTQNDAKNDILDFAKKQAANLYNKYSKNVITDMSEFVEDLKDLM